MTEPTPTIRKPRFLQASLALLAGLLLLVLALLALRQPPAHASQPLGDQPAVTNQPLQAVPVFQQQTVSALSICSQHAPKCPLTAAGWPGEPDGWQYTGKKWIWVPGTPNIYDRQAVWEYSQPYTGSTPEYIGQREDHYAACSGDPADCSLVSGTHPVTYDWERWLQEGDNYRVMQLGNVSEAEAYLLGETDCTSGIIYPVVDHQQPFASTPMYTNRWEVCNGNGYVAASLYELWGEPMSQKRISLCDNPVNGIPASLSPAGNTVCKISPYAGVVFQRYIFGSEVPSEPASVGCEAVLYAWGWSEPLAPDSAQAYQAWFRNGELRFTRWHDLSDQVTPGVIPAADDDDWWDPRCQDAWTELGNWLYTGTYRTGANEYSDQAQLPLLNTIQIRPLAGAGSWTSSIRPLLSPAGPLPPPCSWYSLRRNRRSFPPRRDCSGLAQPSTFSPRIRGHLIRFSLEQHTRSPSSTTIPRWAARRAAWHCMGGMVASGWSNPPAPSISRRIPSAPRRSISRCGR